jgi:hypothetical protein
MYDFFQIERYISKSLIHSILWSFTGDAKIKVREEMSDFIRSATTIALPPNPSISILDYEVSEIGSIFSRIFFLPDFVPQKLFSVIFLFRPVWILCLEQFIFEESLKT